MTDASFKPPPSRHPNQRAGLFVDTQNLYYSARDLSRKALDSGGRYVDYETLTRYVAQGRRLAFATAYVVEREGDTAAHGFIAKLSNLGYRVRRKLSRLRYTDDHGEPVFEGDWDMGIAADIVKSLDFLDVIALASGDGDFVPILRLAQERGVRVEVYGFRHTTSQDLIDCADVVHNLADMPDMLI
ncbi:MAG: NYN domain-containing protein [Deinococcota bacterium]